MDKLAQLAPEYLPGQEPSLDLKNLPSNLDVDVGGEPMQSAGEDGVQFRDLGTGGVEVNFDPNDKSGAAADDELGDPLEHGANLAEHLSEGVLDIIATEIEEWVDMDVASRLPWYNRLAEGLKLLGVVPDETGSGAFKLVSKVNHPIIAEAAVQFQARAMAELLPPTGPAKGMVIGDITKALTDQAERQAEYINYKLMVEDTDYYPESDKMLFVLSYEGSQFKKIYRDPLLRRTVSRWVRGADFLVPYGATSLEGATRYTHRQEFSHNDMLRMMQSGFYRQCDLPEPMARAPSDANLQEKKDVSQGQTDTALVDGEVPHTTLECHCYYDIEGFEHVDDDGEPTGIGLPYIITMDKESRKILAIRRNWKEGDEQQRKIVSFVHYPYLPGDGFYSYGLIHLIGGLAYAASGILRILMLGGAFASLQGGFKAKGGAKTESSVELEFGVYKDTDSTYEELNKTFYTPPFKEPGETLHKVLGLLETAAQRFSSTTESMVGDASNTGPVGTTVALIEQGSKVYTGIHKRVHYAQGKELKLYAEVEAENIPDEGYPYAINGKSSTIMRDDFSEAVDVMPVSDPNIFSSTQRIAIAQTLVQRSDAHPDLYDRPKTELLFLKAMRVPDPESVLAKKAKTPRTDPVTENALMIVGKAAKVFVDQNHQAHMAVHQRQIDEFNARGPSDPIAQRALPILIVHQAEHIALGMRAQYMQAIGHPLAPLDFDPADEGTVTAELPADIEYQVSISAMQAVQKMPPIQQPGNEQAAAQQKQMDEKMKALQAAAAAVEESRKKAELAKNAAEKASAKAAADQQVTALKAQIAEMRLASAHKDVTTNTRDEIQQALYAIEKMIDAKLNKKPAAKP